jgi:hypothetical protein
MVTTKRERYDRCMRLADETRMGEGTTKSKMGFREGTLSVSTVAIDGSTVYRAGNEAASQ